MRTIQLPYNEYQSLKEELSLLKDTVLLKKVNRLIDLMYQEKYGLYLGDYIEDMTEYCTGANWEESESKWDDV